MRSMSVGAWLRVCAIGFLAPMPLLSQTANPAPNENVKAPSSPELGSLMRTNPFDAKREMWPDRTPPPPPPPVPAPITTDDLQLYGVVLSGGAQKALLKLGPRFKGYPVGPTGLASVPVGASIGEFYLAQVQADQVLLKAPGGEQWIRFGSKKDRAGGGVPAPAMAVSPASSMGFTPPAGFPGIAVAPVPVPAPAQAPAPVSVQGAASVSADPGRGAVSDLSVAPAQPVQQAGTPQVAPNEDGATAAQPTNSLAAAIAAVRAGAQAGSATAAKPVNPFEALVNNRR